VRLDVGTLRIHVRRQAPDEHFDVLLPDGEIDVRGTTFDVTATESRTVRVHVDEGVVALRIGAAEEILLPAGSTWPSGEARETLPSEGVVATASPVRAPQVRRSRSDLSQGPASAPVDDGSEAYALAIQLFEARRFADAADAFRQFANTHAGSALAEDASFLEATALARTGRIDAAGIAAEHHLLRYPQSFHRKEAAILVARAARDRGDCARATGVLAPWLAAGDKEANATLRTCATTAP
jgi:TolA-binding protein